MKLSRTRFALGLAVATAAVAACSSQHGSSIGTGSGNGGANVGTLVAGAHTGSVGMHLTIGNGVHVNALNWSISNGTSTATGTVNITDDAGHEAQSIEFVAGDIPAGTGYVVTLSGNDSNGDPCTGTSAPVAVMAGATSAAVVIVTCTVPTDAALATTVDSGNIAVDAGVVLVNQAAFQCPGITGVSISPAEVLPPETAGLTANFTGSSGGVQTLLWRLRAPARPSPTRRRPTRPSPADRRPGTACTVTLTVGLNGTGPDGGIRRPGVHRRGEHHDERDEILRGRRRVPVLPAHAEPLRDQHMRQLPDGREQLRWLRHRVPLGQHLQRGRRASSSANRLHHVALRRQRPEQRPVHGQRRSDGLHAHRGGDRHA